MGISVTVETLQRSGCFCESEATATNVLSVRKRSDSNKCFICAKAKRQQQQQSARRNGNQPLSLQKSHTFILAI
ncbi:hypothetical protein [Lysinibacillus sp. fls2-241-R2A-57]|uniref:hypothetical protein n=1 Tax=Lysinibacillus sp. fls2-241-R2A-57 TaxID=3040292 RepID=UPI0025566868|nr:hypothetical protein [Lysinibacillus sp. fls2-241-R2A-57]